MVTAWPEDYARYGLELVWPVLGSAIAVALWGALPLGWLIVLGVAEFVALAIIIFFVWRLRDFNQKYLFLRRKEGDDEVREAAKASPWAHPNLATAWTMGLDRAMYHYDVEVHVATKGRETQVGMPEEFWQKSTPEERQFLLRAQLIRKWKVRALWRIGLIRVAACTALAGIAIFNGWIGVVAVVLTMAACIKFLPWMVHGRNDWLAAQSLENPETALSALELVHRESDPAFPKPFLASRIKMMRRRLRLPG